MAFTNPNNDPANKKAKAVEYINSTLANSDSISEDQWKQLQTLLFHGNKSIVISQIKYIYSNYCNEPLSNETLQDLTGIFYEFISERRFFLNYKLVCEFSHTDAPGAEFLQWLLDIELMHFVEEYERKQHCEPRIFVTFLDNIEENGSNNLETKTNEETAERQKLNRYNQDKEICKKSLVQFILRSIAAEMTKKTNWQKEVVFRQVGLQMHPFLQSRDIELEPDNFAACKQLKDHVEDYVRNVHQSQSNFNAADYLTQKHDLAQKRIAEQRKQLEALFKTARPDSNKRRCAARQLLKLIEEEWLAPLDNEMISEICKIRLQYANLLLFRYRDVFLSEIYDMVDNYQEG